MEIVSLNRWEIRLCDILTHGQAVDFGGEAAVIRAGVLRRLLLGLPLTARCKSPRRIPNAGVVVRNAVIDGRIDLDNASSDGDGALCALVLEDCELRGGLTAAHAHLGRLSLDRSTFVQGAMDEPTINLADCACASDVSLRDIRPRQDEGLLWIRAKGARIDGDLDFCDATLRADPPARDRRTRERRHVAMAMQGIEITGEILGLNAQIHGGLAMLSAHVQGSVWLGGAFLRAFPGQNALDMQNAVINGNLDLGARPDSMAAPDPRRFRSEGQVWLMACRVDGILNFGGADISAVSGATPGDDAPAEALNLDMMTVSKDVFALAQDGPTRIRGGLSARNLQVGGSATLSRIRLGFEGKAESSLDLRGARIEGDLEVTAVRPPDGEQNRPMSAERRRENGPSITLYMTGLQAASISMAQVEIGRVSAVGMVSRGNCDLGLTVKSDADFTGSKIDGALDLSHFMFAAGGSEQLLKFNDAHVGRALRVGGEWRREGEPSRVRLVAAREKRLVCYPGWRFVEGLWLGLPELEERDAAQSAHLIHDDGSVRTLTGQSEDFHVLNDQGSLSLTDIAGAEEYLRLFSGSIRGDEGAFRIVDGWSDVRAEPEAFEGKPVTDADFRMTPGSDGAAYVFDAMVAYGNALFRVKQKVSPKGAVEMLEDTPLAQSETMSSPQFRGKLIIAKGGDSGAKTWPQTPLLPGSREIEENRLKALQAKLEPQITAVSLFSAEVNLEDLSCETLEDDGGAAWGEDVTLKLDRLTYRHMTRKNAELDLPQRARPLLLALDRLGGAWLKTRLEKAGLADNWRRAVGEMHTAWERRRDWLYLQYPGVNVGVAPPFNVYHSQPFAQAIRVFRFMGDEEAATELEILKHRIEARHFADRTLPSFVGAGLLLGVTILALLVWSGWGIWGGLLIAAAAAATLGGAAYAGDALYRWMFGYLKKPLRALGTIIVSFGVGWMGVHSANSNERLVVDVTPVASVLRQDANTLIVASPVVEEVARASVACGDSINEALYAVDLFIPLVDLRQESRCEVGVPDRGVSDDVAGTDRSNPLRSTIFWDAMKAVYAVAGWLVISLSILTFAQVARRRDEETA